VRKDLVKSALRDAVFETILSNVNAGFPSPELFSLAARLLSRLEQQVGATPALLWKFYKEFSALLGFGLNCDACVSCGKKLASAAAAFLIVEKGGFACDRCVCQKDIRNEVPPALAGMLTLSADNSLSEEITGMSAAQARSITRLLASYCRFHCETTSEYKALEFLDTLFTEEIVRRD
jgi:recombinational DNA repair protein (RecF pathway)